MITGIDHIGIFVRDIESAVDLFCRTYHLARPPIIDVVSRRKKVAWIEFGECALELLEDYDPESEFYRRVQAEGSFMHHFAVASTEVGRDAEALAARGCSPAPGGPQIGLRGKEIQFIKDKALALDIELTEPTRERSAV